MTKTCSGCNRGTTIQADCMWCDECENAYQAKKNCQHQNKRFYSINHGTRFREKYHRCEDCGIKIGGNDDELDSVRADRDLLDDANIDLNYKVIAMTKQLGVAEEALKKLSWLNPQMKNVGIPCPDGKSGCAVYHYKQELDLDPGLVARDALTEIQKLRGSK